MQYISIPTREEILQLAEYQAEGCVSIYLKVSPLPQDAPASRTALSNKIKEAFTLLEERGVSKKTLEPFCEELLHVVEDHDFWNFHAKSLAVLAAPGFVRTYWLANNLQDKVRVSDVFYLKPLLRAITFPHNAYVLALSENEARFIEFFSDALPEVLEVPNMPQDAHSAVGRPSLHHTSVGHSAQSGSSGVKLRHAQYCRKVDAAIRPLCLANNAPLILISTVGMAAIFRSVASVPNLLAEGAFTSTDRVSVGELAEMARPILDAYYADKVAKMRERFEERAGQNRVATDLADVARAATLGMVSTLLIDFERDATGSVAENGAVTFSTEAGSCSVVDEITKRALETGADVLAVRADEMFGDTGMAAILRYPFA